MSPASGKLRGKWHFERVYINNQRGAASSKPPPQPTPDYILLLCLPGASPAPAGFGCWWFLTLLLHPLFKARAVPKHGFPLLKSHLQCPSLLQAQALGSCSTAQKFCTSPALMPDLSRSVPFVSRRNELWHLAALCRMGKGAPRDSTAIRELPKLPGRSFGSPRLPRESGDGKGCTENPLSCLTGPTACKTLRRTSGIFFCFVSWFLMFLFFFFCTIKAHLEATNALQVWKGWALNTSQEVLHGSWWH